jgi:F-type H+-transporting ATPase subunit delta
MIPSKAARRYASALLQYAVESKKLDAVYKDVEFIGETLRQSKELKLFFKSPVVKSVDKSAVLKELFKDQVSAETASFLELLASKERFELLSGIMEAFVKAYQDYSGITTAQVFYAQKLTKKQLDDIRKALEKRTGKKVTLETTEKPGLLGGVVVKLGDTVIDGSVKYKLEQLESMFFRAAI